MKSLTLLLLLFLTTPVYSQAVWRGRTYNHPVCSNPNCRMCNSIRNQLYQPTYQSYQPTYQSFSQSFNQPSFQSSQLTYQSFSQSSQSFLQPSFIPLPSDQLLPTAFFQPKIISQDAAEEPTPIELIPLIFELVPLDKDDIFVDIGCGDGRILKEASKSGCFSIGIEINPELATRASQIPNVKIINKDALEYDYSIATVVYMYLYPDLMEKIIPKLVPGTVVVSYSHRTQNMAWNRFGNFYVGTK